MKIEFLYIIYGLIMFLSNGIILLKSRFNLKILMIYTFLCLICILLSNSLHITGIFMSAIFGIFYYYVIPNRLKKERIEDEKITEDLDYFFSLSKEEKEEYYKKRNIYKNNKNK